jgi:hypothetical protein
LAGLFHIGPRPGVMDLIGAALALRASDTLNR